MSEIKALEKLCELACDINEREIVDHMQLYPSCVFDGTWLDGWHREFDRLAAEIEREIAERYMELPVDADGVPILLDDVVKPDGDEPFEVRALMLDAAGWFVIERLGSNWSANQVRHVKQRTLEDVLEKFGVKYMQVCEAPNPKVGFGNEIIGEEEPDEIIAKYATEIRELLGVVA